MHGKTAQEITRRKMTKDPKIPGGWGRIMALEGGMEAESDSSTAAGRLQCQYITEH
jgi:hypothetical protein